jgi:L-ribulose-5-phosphate 4-epimerase
MTSRVSGTSGIDPGSELVRLARDELVSISHRAYQRGLVVGVSGNNSIRVADTDAFLIKATGSNQGDMDAQDTVLVDLQGNVLEEGKRPSKEVRWHLAIYQQNPGVGGIVHVHPPYATAWAVANRTPPLIHTAARGVLRKIALVDLAPSGSEELANMIAEAFSDEDTASLPWVRT